MYGSLLYVYLLLTFIITEEFNQLLNATDKGKYSATITFIQNIYSPMKFLKFCYIFIYELFINYDYKLRL